MSTSRDDIQGLVRQRRLAAIMMADISGYSRLMGVDEEGTLSRMRRLRREIIDPAISEHHGRLVNAPGDSMLAVFDSPLEAVRCALVIQQSIFARNVSLPRSAWFQYRIGVNLGDIIVDPSDGTVYGDGVNVAARLEAMAEPGGVLISGGVYEQIKNKLVCGYQSLGDEKLKNITDPVHVYKVLPDPAAVSRATRAKAGRWIALTAATGLALVLGLGVYGTVQPAFFWSQISTLRHQLGLDAPAPAIQTSASKPSVDTQASVGSQRPVGLTSPGQQASRPSEPQDVAATFTTLPPEAASKPPEARIPQGPTPTPGKETSFVRETTPAPNIPAYPPMTDPVQPPALSAMLPPAGTGKGKSFDDGKTFRDCDQCPDMIRLRGGSFRMGSGEDSSEQPIHQVSIQPFALSRFPITNREWRACNDAKACRFVPDGADDSPIRNVSWADVQEYVAWLTRITGQTYRLPSEAEWEYAARAGTITRYWWGDRMAPKMANCRGCGDPYDARQPLPVGSTAPNPFGFYGMGGGVAQWVADCWHPNYLGAPSDGSARTENDCLERVVRGGSWRNSSSEIRPGSRAHYEAGVRHPNHGFRVARSN